MPVKQQFKYESPFKDAGGIKRPENILILLKDVRDCIVRIDSTSHVKTFPSVKKTLEIIEKGKYRSDEEITKELDLSEAG